MNSITLKAFAKINLTLDVLGKLPNGFHQVEMIKSSYPMKRFRKIHGQTQMKNSL